MVDSSHERLEQEIRSRHARADIAGAAEAALRGYGSEIYGFLWAFHRREQDADEVFSIFAERIVLGLPSFAWHCSFRTWAYTVARNAARNYQAQESRRQRRHLPLPEGSDLAAIVGQVRTETRSYLKTGARTRVDELRAALSEEERMLLSLRLDRELAWADIARILREDRGEPSDEELRRESARLRKRFQSIKDRIADLLRR